MNKRSKWFNKMLSGILVLLGFSSCSNSNDPEEFICLYGSPTASHQIKGKVQNEGKSPIPGIQVIIQQQRNRQSYSLDTLRTNDQGEFDFSWGGSMAEEEYRAIFHDVDGEAYGGIFESDSIDFKTIQTEKGEGWYQGKGEATVEMTLKLKENKPE